MITVMGKVSGREYTIPVQYGCYESSLVIITSEDYRWWRNLTDGAEVTLLLRGKVLTGRAQIETERAAVEGAAHVVYPRLKDEQFDRFFQNSLAVIISLPCGD